MESLRIGIVSRDPGARDAAARAFDAAPSSWAVELFEDRPQGMDIVVTTPEISDVEGIRFDPARPEAVIEAIQRRTTMASTFVIAGATGGCGCTSIALHLGKKLAAGRAIVCELPDGIRLRLGLPVDAVRLSNPESSDGDLRRAALPVADGFRVVLASPAMAEDPAVTVARVATVGDRIVVDAGTEFPPSLLGNATAVVLVVPPSRVGAERARQILSSVPAARWAVVTNQTGPGGTSTSTAVARILGRRISLTLPCCPSLRDAEDEMRLLANPWNRWTRGIDRLATALLRA